MKTIAQVLGNLRMPVNTSSFDSRTIVEGGEWLIISLDRGRVLAEVKLKEFNLMSLEAPIQYLSHSDTERHLCPHCGLISNRERKYCLNCGAQKGDNPLEEISLL